MREPIQAHQAHIVMLDGVMTMLIQANRSLMLRRVDEAITPHLPSTQLGIIENHPDKSHTCEATQVSPTENQQDGWAHRMCKDRHKTDIIGCLTTNKAGVHINKHVSKIRILTA